MVINAALVAVGNRVLLADGEHSHPDLVVARRPKVAACPLAVPSSSGGKPFSSSRPAPYPAQNVEKQARASPGGARRCEPRGEPRSHEGDHMGRVEYKVEQVYWKDEPETRLAQLVEILNGFAKEGWRVVSVDLLAHAEFGTKSLPVLLEREVK